MKTTTIRIAALFLSLFLMVAPAFAHAQEASYDLSASVVGTSANITVRITGLTFSPAQYSLGLGTTKDNGATCVDSGLPHSSQVSVAASSVTTLNYTPTLTPGVMYCVSVWKFDPSLVTNNIIHTFQGKTISTGFVSVSGTDVPTGTQPGQACVANGTDEYCLLAPIPGLSNTGDPAKISFSKTCVVDGVENSGLGCYINGIIRIVIGLVGVLSVIMIIVGGLEYMSTTSAGEKGSAKSRILNALFGLVLALSSYMILYTINPQLVALQIRIDSGKGLTFDPSIDEPPTETYTYVGADGKTYGNGVCPQNRSGINVKIQYDGDPVVRTVNMPIVAGAVWPDDNANKIENVLIGDKKATMYGTTERVVLSTGGVSFNHYGSIRVGQKGVTSVFGLPESSRDGLLALAKACGPNCVEVTGGTECWLHRSHGPGLSPVDLAPTPKLIDFIKKATGRAVTVGQKYEVPVVSETGGRHTMSIWYENSAHFHVFNF